MVDRPELHEAVAGAKSSASDYNDNFDMMMDYCEDYNAEALSIYQTVNTLETTAGTIYLQKNKCYKITPTAFVTFDLPGVDSGKYGQILVQVNLTDVSFLSGDYLGTTEFFNNKKPVFEYTGYYDLVYEYNNFSNKWCVGAISKGAV